MSQRVLSIVASCQTSPAVVFVFVDVVTVIVADDVVVAVVVVAVVVVAVVVVALQLRF